MNGTKIIKRKLRRIPRYSFIISERTGLSRMTIYRVLRGDSSPNIFRVLKTAQELIDEHQGLNNN